MWPLDTGVSRSAVCVFACLLSTLVSPAEAAEQIDILFGRGRLVWAQGTVYWMGVHWRHSTNTMK